MNDLLLLEVGEEVQTGSPLDQAGDVVEQAFASPGVQPTPARMPEPGSEVLFEE